MERSSAGRGADGTTGGSTDFARTMERWRAGVEGGPPVARLLGLSLVSFGDGAATLALEAGERHHNPMGIVHGGILTDLADAAMGVAAATTIAPGETFSTVSLSVTFLRFVKAGHLLATATVLRRGRRTIALESEVKDERGRLVVKAASSCLVDTARLEERAG